MARPGVVAVLDMDISWPPFRLERVVLFSVQNCILQQLVTVASHLQRPTRLRVVRQPLQRLGPNRAVGVEPAARRKAPFIVLVTNHRFSIKIKLPLPKKRDDRYLCGFSALGTAPQHSPGAAAAHPQPPGGRAPARGGGWPCLAHLARPVPTGGQFSGAFRVRAEIRAAAF